MTQLSGKVDAMAYLEEHGYPEVGVFAEKKDIQKFYKQLPTEFLEDWCAEKELTPKPCPENDSIHRMRVAQAILELHFPTAKKATGSKSKYQGVTDEQLAQMCIDHEVPLEVCEHKGIMRMRMIQALRAHGKLV